MANSTESIIPDPTEELLQQYADLGDSLKGRIPCLEWEFPRPMDSPRYVRSNGSATRSSWRTTIKRPKSFTRWRTSPATRLLWRRKHPGVDFIAETAKVLAPDRTILIPDVQAGCSLASSITAEDVRRLRKRYPGVPVVTYVNTSAGVKAESDACCTSANALQVVEAGAGARACQRGNGKLIALDSRRRKRRPEQAGRLILAMLASAIGRAHSIGAHFRRDAGGTGPDAPAAQRSYDRLPAVAGLV